MPRHRFQFRLRTLMLLVTLACVLAAWIGWMNYKARIDESNAQPKPMPPEKSTVIHPYGDKMQPREP